MHAPQGWADFRAKREETLREPYGWLTIRSFHRVPDEPAELPGLPGRWWVDGEDAVVDLTDHSAKGDGLTGPRRATVAETGRTSWLERTVDVGGAAVGLSSCGAPCAPPPARVVAR